ncbi:sulfurtransferase-like selenium metabolism protein YedF [Falsiporphyromonas endometrii]|uniref:Sulfurtransferase-like selenium metabolism protein YedF n=1 Tax=Falsiporphyromonas endometrii TaxID=1387297 RepID=A0ABV9K7X5_9PORP
MSVKVDTRGKLCPLPLIMLRQALKKNDKETRFEVLTDNETACGNLTDFITQSGFAVNRTTEEDYTLLIIDTKGINIAPIASQPNQEAECILPTQKGISVVQLRSNVMGQGEDQLGEILILAYLNALNELDELPTHIICYNTAIKLATKTHPAHESLKKLAAKGVEIIVCGTCLDYFKEKENLSVGKVSNMFVIADLLSRANHIVTP